MRTGHFVPLIACKKGFSNNVSGHVQLPLHAIRLLADAGHDVHLFTNAPTEDRPDPPDILPENITLHYVDDARKRTKVVDGVGGAGKGTSIRRLWKQMGQIKSLARELDLEVFHAYGYGRTATLTAMLRASGLRTPMVVTLFGLAAAPSGGQQLIRRFWKGIQMVAATEYVAGICRASDLDVTLVRQGAVRNFVAELNGAEVKPRKRVLFWRDPTIYNGADLCIEAFGALAPRFPDVTFEMAIRPHWNEVDGIEALDAAHGNVLIHRFPYDDGVSLADLVTGSLCIPLPFRKHSINPQLAIAESLAAGVPVITSDLGSAPELVEDGDSGLVVPIGDAPATAAAIEELLLDPPRAAKMGRHAAQIMARYWGWTTYVDDISRVYDRASSRA